MVNFRFHVVSIIAIFLAIAIGTVVGATFVGRGVVENLQNRIDHADRTSSDVKAKNERLESQAEQVGKYVDGTEGYAVGRALAGSTIDLVVERGVDSVTVDQQVQLLRRAGATVPGVVWLEEPWKLRRPDQLVALRTATGLSDRAPASLRTSAAGLLGRRLAAEPVAGAEDVLANLADAGFVRLSGVAGSRAPTPAEFGTSGSRTLVLGGPSSSVPADTTHALVAGGVDGKRLLTVGEVFTGAGEVSERDQWIDAIAGDVALRNHVSTVDDVDRVEGRVASTLALAALAAGRFGNYGLGREQAVPPDVLTTPLSR